MGGAGNDHLNAIRKMKSCQLRPFGRSNWIEFAGQHECGDGRVNKGIEIWRQGCTGPTRTCATERLDHHIAEERPARKVIYSWGPMRGTSSEHKTESMSPRLISLLALCDISWVAATRVSKLPSLASRITKGTK